MADQTKELLGGLESCAVEYAVDAHSKGPEFWNRKPRKKPGSPT